MFKFIWRKNQKFLTRRVSPPARRVQHIGGRMPEHSASCGSKMEPKSYQKWSPKPWKSEENRVQTRPGHPKIRKNTPTQQRRGEHPSPSPLFCAKCSQHSFNLASKIQPKSLKKLFQNWSKFGLLWASLFVPILVDFRRQNGSKLAPRCDSKSTLASKGRFVQKLTKTIGKSWFLRFLGF